MISNYWNITDKGDQDVRLLADRHYSRQTPGSPQYCRNGQNLVFITDQADAGWVTFRPTPGEAKRQDNLDAWECALFRNEGPVKSSLLIREAVMLSIALWGPLPPDGFITYVKAEAVRTGAPGGVPGYCYRRAGWRHVGESADGKPMFRAPRPALSFFDLSYVLLAGHWDWRGNRGGLLRRGLEEPDPLSC